MEEERRPLDRTERWYAWALGILGGATTLISFLTRPDTDDLDGFIGMLGVVFSISYLVLLGLAIAAARWLLSSTVARIATIVVGPVVGMMVVLAVARALV